MRSHTHACVRSHGVGKSCEFNLILAHLRAGIWVGNWLLQDNRPLCILGLQTLIQNAVITATTH